MNEDMEEMQLDLLIKQAVYGLTEAEQKQLDELENDGARDDSLERTTAAVNLAGVDKIEAMPNALRSKILANADKYFGTEEDAEPAPNIREIVTPAPMLRAFWAWVGVA